MHTTTDQLLEDLKLLAGQFYITPFEKIRQIDSIETCPICALANYRLGVEKWTWQAMAAADDMGYDLGHQHTRDAFGWIIGAADYPRSPYRHALEQALGIL